MKKLALVFLFIGFAHFPYAQNLIEEISCGIEVELAKGIKQDKTVLWPSQVIPYDIEASASSAESAIKLGILTLNTRTNVCLVPKGRQDNAVIKFKASSNSISSSGIGYTPSGTSIKINIQNGGYSGTVIHEVIHSLGFWHEHQRLDRDDFIKINYNNIQSAYTHNFNLISGEIITPYDFTSIMHYSAGAFSIDTNTPVIEGRNGEKIGSEGILTDIDIADINHFYPKKLSCDSLYALFPPIPRFTFEYTYDSWCRGYRLHVVNQTTDRERYDPYWEIKNEGNIIARGQSQDTVFYLPDGINTISLEISNQHGINSSSRNLELKRPNYQLQINPNPVEDILRFRINGDFEKIEYSIRNLAGKVLFEASALDSACNAEEEIDLSSIGAGVYFLYVKADGQVSAKSFVRI